MEKLTQQEQVRRQKMQDLIDMGIDPFGSRYDRTSNSGIIKSSYEDKTKEELDELQVTVKIAGRIMTKRRQGKAGFMNIRIVKVKFRFMFVKMKLVMINMKSSRKMTLEIS